MSDESSADGAEGVAVAPSGGPAGRATDMSWALWALAVLATLTAILSRALAPSLRGVWEGADHVISFVTVAAAASSQMVAVGCAVMVTALVMSVLTSSLPQYARAFSVGAGMLAVLALAISSISVHLPSNSRLVVALSSVGLTFTLVRISAKNAERRAASLALGCVAVAGAFRVITVLIAKVSLQAGAESWATAARSFATLQWLADFGAIIIMLVLLTTQPSQRRALDRARWAVLGTVLLVPAVGVVLVIMAGDPERSGIFALISNIAHHTSIQPDPYIFNDLRSYVEFLRWFVAAGLLVILPSGRGAAAALSLALFSRSTLEVPLCAAAVVVAGLALALAEALEPRPGFGPASSDNASGRE